MKLQKLLLITASATAIMACASCSNNKAYTVTFETNGGTEIKEVKVSDKLTKPEDPVKRPYVFGGWYTTQDFSTKFDFSKAITEDTTLYAKWNESIQFTYVYHEDEGDGENVVKFDLDYLHFDEVSSKYFDLVVKWGDGASDTFTSAQDPATFITNRSFEHEYNNDKDEYQITIDGLVNGIYFNDYSLSSNAQTGFPAGNRYLKSMNVNQLVYYDVVDYHAQLGSEGSDDTKSELSDITLPDDLTYISDFTFTSTAITRYAINDNITRIGHAAFANSDIKTIDFSKAESLYTISTYAFNSCNQLKDVVFPESLSAINDSAFVECPELSEVTFTSYMPPFVSENAFIVTPTSNAPMQGLNKVYVPKGRKSAYIKAWWDKPELASIVEEME